MAFKISEKSAAEELLFARCLSSWCFSSLVDNKLNSASKQVLRSKARGLGRTKRGPSSGNRPTRTAAATSATSTRTTRTTARQVRAALEGRKSGEKRAATINLSANWIAPRAPRSLQVLSAASSQQHQRQSILWPPARRTTNTRAATTMTSARTRSGKTNRNSNQLQSSPLPLLLPLLLLTAATTLTGSLGAQGATANQQDSSQRLLLSRSLVIGQPATTTTAPPTTTQTPVEVPDFLEPIGNHTVALGRDAQLSCKINNLGNFRTAWLRVEDKGILTIHNNIITRNYRVGLINNDDGRNFILTIKNVQPSDKGGYMCQINSVPMKYAIGYLDVLTPPVFEDSSTPTATSGATNETPGALVASGQQATSSSPGAAASVVTVGEGGNATLSCKATGHPSPVIVWRREDNEPIRLDGAYSTDASSEGQAKVEGASITLSSVSRLNSGAYLCIASNGVQPSASRRQVLDVQFKPIVMLPAIEKGASLNQDEVRLNCYVDLNPLGSYHWVKVPTNRAEPAAFASNAATSSANYKRWREQTLSGVSSNEDDSSLIEHDELHNSDKFEIVITQVNSEKVHMALLIRQIERQDFAWYKCIARNSLGTQSNAIRLYESSSFSLNNMFNRAGAGAAQDQPEGGGAGPPEHQNDQQQEQQPPGRGNSQQANGRQTGNGGSSRAHTRSSWVQRQLATAGRQQDLQANALLDSAASSATRLAAATPTFAFSRLWSSLLLLQHQHQHYYYYLLLLLSCFFAGALSSRGQLLLLPAA